MKRAQRHMKIKEMAKKTSLATSSEEDKTTDTGMGDYCIRVVIALNYYTDCDRPCWSIIIYTADSMVLVLH